MGNFNVTKCIFTDLPATPIFDGNDFIEYVVEVLGKKHLIRLPFDALTWSDDEPYFQENKWFFEALLYNDNWFEDEKIYIKIEDLKSLLENANIPRTPQQKLDTLFLKLFSFQKEEGQEIDTQEIYHHIFWKVLYFKSLTEFNYYLEYLVEIGLIEGRVSNSKEGWRLQSYKITFYGLNYAIELQEEGEKSDKCFVAMAFRDETKDIRNAIKSALVNTGFQPVIIDEEDIDSDKTINDQIIANLKKCKFCVADFSFHSNGVYFESGFALGRGMKVIYMCQSEEFKKAHFDIRPLQHIIYENSKQLETLLINKINAWIKD